MTFGIEARNAADRAVIGGGVHQSLEFHRKVTAHLQGTVDGVAEYMDNDRVALGEYDYSQPPVAFYRVPPPPPPQDGRTYVTGEGYGIIFLGLEWVSSEWHASFGRGRSVDTTIDVYVFNFLEPPIGDGWGLQVFNDDGSLAFDSSKGSEPMILSALGNLNRGSDSYISENNYLGNYHYLSFGNDSFSIPSTISKPCIPTIGYYYWYGYSETTPPGGGSVDLVWNIGGIYYENGTIFTRDNSGFHQTSDWERHRPMLDGVWHALHVPVIDGALYD